MEDRNSDPKRKNSSEEKYKRRYHARYERSPKSHHDRKKESRGHSPRSRNDRRASSKDRRSGSRSRSRYDRQKYEHSSRHKRDYRPRNSRSRSRSRERNNRPRNDRQMAQRNESSNEFLSNRIKTPKQRLETLKTEISLLLSKDAPRKPYDKGKSTKEKLRLIHWGQRKLFMSELWFLTKYGDLGSCVVYAGSAPGTHIPFLSYLFPTHKFILVDPSDFSMKYVDEESVTIEQDTRAYVKNDNRIRAIQGYFDDDLATAISQQHDDILFISDIRTADTKTQDQEMIEIMVYKDNIKQKDWINIMKPKKSLLKFRCPYPDRENGKNNLVMFDGDIYLQPWAGPTSTETRLIPYDSLTEVEYDNQKYEEQLCYHNDVVRRAEYSQPIRDGEGFDTRWDVSAEVLILNDFLLKFPQYYQELSEFEKIKRFSEDISRHCTWGGRNLTTPMKPREDRRNFGPKDHTSFHFPEKKL